MNSRSLIEKVYVSYRLVEEVCTSQCCEHSTAGTRIHCSSATVEQCSLCPWQYDCATCLRLKCH